MDHEYDQDRKHSRAAATTPNNTVEPGQSSRSALLRRPEQPIASGLIQRKAGDAQAASALQRKPVAHVTAVPSDGALGGETPSAIHAAAAIGTTGPAMQLPHLEQIQRSFGGHDLSHVKAFVGGPAAKATRAMGSEAYAMGTSVVFAGEPSLHIAAHEAAHVVQQHGGVQLLGGIGQDGDAHERHADAVADRVVAGMSAEDLLGQYAAPQSKGEARSAAAVQLFPKKTEQGWVDSKYDEMIMELIIDESPRVFKVVKTGEFLAYDDAYFVLSREPQKGDNVYDLMGSEYDFAPFKSQKKLDHYDCNDYDELVDIGKVALGQGGNETERYLSLLNGMKSRNLIPAVQVDKKYNVVNGNHRLKVSMELGFTKLPIKFV